MSRIFITGSSDGLGLMAPQLLVKQGHSVVLHARTTSNALKQSIAGFLGPNPSSMATSPPCNRCVRSQMR
jgi:NAD(P)-dependent dehydrogenase (short-subunit alcohol dehydrogenase family)